MRAMDKDALIASLEKTIATQTKLIETQAQQLSQQTVLLEKLHQQVEQLLRQLYGKKSEKKSKANASVNESISGGTANKKSNKFTDSSKPKRSKLPANLETVVVTHDLSTRDKQCHHCDRQLKKIGQRVTEQLDYIPGKLIKRQHVCLKYACQCEQAGVKIARLPNQPIEKGSPGPGLLAEVLVGKFQDAMPLYRQGQRFKRQGYAIADSTLGDWVASCADLFTPLVEQMRFDLLLANKLHTDDTPVPVLAKGKTRQGRLWVYLADHHAPFAMCLYDYTPTRSGNGPQKYLKSYQGYLQADAFSGYDALYQGKKIIEVGCMAHARRKFYEIATAAKGPSYAADIVEKIGELYDIERQLKEKSNSERYYYRKKYAKAKLKKLKQMINHHIKRTTKGSPFYKALQYASNHWIALTRYLACGELDIDNNKAERAIKPLVIGRKNWLFAGSDEGGKRAAIIYSIIETCKMNDINPFDYMTDVLTKLPNTLQKNIRQLLPYHWKKSQLVSC